MKSYLHCHSKNLHSVIVGRDVGDNLIRMFIADTGHELYKNNPSGIYGGEQSLTIHGHKSDITLVPLTGRFSNISMALSNKVAGFGDSFKVSVNAYKYQSEIVDNKGGFIWQHGVIAAYIKSKEVKESLYLPYDQLHSIYVRKNTTASWLVVEGKENPSPVDDLCYSSNSELCDWTADGLYEVMTEDKRIELLNKYLYNINP